MFTRFPKLLLGLEILFFYDVNYGKFSYLAFYPQVQAQFTNEVKIDVGPGFIFTLNKFVPEFVARVLIENFPGVEEEGEEEGDKEEGHEGTKGQRQVRAHDEEVNESGAGDATNKTANDEKWNRK